MCKARIVPSHGYYFTSAYTEFQLPVYSAVSLMRSFFDTGLIFKTLNKVSIIRKLFYSLFTSFAITVINMFNSTGPCLTPLVTSFYIEIPKPTIYFSLLLPSVVAYRSIEDIRKK